MSKTYTTPTGKRGRIENQNQFDGKLSSIREHIKKNIFDIAQEADIIGMYPGRVQRQDDSGRVYFDFPDNIKKGLASKSSNIVRETRDVVLRQIGGITIGSSPNADIVGIVSKTAGSAEFPIRGKDGKEIAFSSWYINESDITGYSDRFNAIGLSSISGTRGAVNLRGSIDYYNRDNDLKINKFIKEAK